MPHLRWIRPEDARAVLTAARLFDDPPDDHAVRAFLADPTCRLLIAYMAGEPAGFVRAHELRQLSSPKPQMLLYEIGVLEEYRHRGIGRALIEELKRYCRARGFDEIFVITEESNEAAVRLYEATGGVREILDDVVFVYPLKE